MKIGLVCPYNIFKGGGVQECVCALQTELLARGHDAKIIAPQPRSHKAHTKEGVLFVGGAADLKSPFHTVAQISASIDTEALELMLNQENFDILHFHEPWVPMLSRQILSRSHSINIATFHAKLPDTVMSRTIEKVITPYTKPILKQFHAITAVSDAAAEYVKSLTSDTVTIIPNGVDLSIYTPNTKMRDSKDVTILYIGRLEKRKGVKYLLEAVSKLQNDLDSLKLIIAGDGPDREKLELQAQELGLRNVQFLGFVSHEEKLNLLRTSDLFCTPALYGESFGIVLLEAMATGIPVVAGNNPGYTAVLKGRGEISLVDPTHLSSFASRLKLMLTDADIRQSWKNWAVNEVQQYTYTHIVDAYEELYEHVANHHDTRRK